MAGKKTADPADACPTDAELDAMVAECEALKQTLSAPPKVGAAPGATAAVDPASILVFVEMFLKVVEWFRSRRNP